MIELRHIRYFLAVAEHLHFGRAADALHIAQPPLSQQIQQLERLVGEPLFTRRPRVELTPAGRVFAEYARRTLGELRHGVDAARAAAAGHTGEIRVGFAASALLSPLGTALMRYRAKYRDVRLSLVEASTADHVDALRNGRVDVAFLRTSPGEIAGLTIEELDRERFAVALPPRHRLAKRRSIRLAELKNEPFILFPRDVAPQLHDQVRALFRTAGFEPEVIVEAKEWLTIVGLVASGMGLSIVPQSIRQLRWGGVTYPFISAASEVMRVFLATAAQRTNPALPQFLSVVRATYKSGHK